MHKNLPTQYQQFIHLSRYARWDYEKGRRETWDETIERYFNFFTEHLEETCGYKLDNGDYDDFTNERLETIQGIYEGLNQYLNLNCSVE